MPKMIFVNLPVRDIAAATRFYEAIGCTKNPQFSDEKSASMVWSDTITFQLLTQDYFKTYLTKPIADARAATGVLFALSQDSREAVDAVVEAAKKHGGRADVREAQDLGFMYLRSFEDPDGHVFEPAFMDMSQLPG
jgi:uncharacterized protein